MSGSNLVNANLDKWAKQRLAGVQGVATIIASEAAKESKANHPWENDTHHAEQGLYGKVRKDGSKFVIEHGHRVDYGVWLELANDGKYGILEKTLNSLRGKFLSMVKQIMESRI